VGKMGSVWFGILKRRGDVGGVEWWSLVGFICPATFSAGVFAL